MYLVALLELRDTGAPRFNAEEVACFGRALIVRFGVVVQKDGGVSGKSETVISTETVE